MHKVCIEPLPVKSSFTFNSGRWPLVRQRRIAHYQSPLILASMLPFGRRRTKEFEFDGRGEWQRHSRADAPILLAKFCQRSKFEIHFVVCLRGPAAHSCNRECMAFDEQKPSVQCTLRSYFWTTIRSCELAAAYIFAIVFPLFATMLSAASFPRQQRRTKSIYMYTRGVHVAFMLSSLWESIHLKITLRISIIRVN